MRRNLRIAITRGALSGALLLALNLGGRKPLQAQAGDLPDAPQPSGFLTSSGTDEVAAATGSLPAVAGIWEMQTASSPEYPPAHAVPAPGRTARPLARPDIPDIQTECQAEASSTAEQRMSCRPDLHPFILFLNYFGPMSPLTPKKKFLLAVRSVGDPFNLLTIGGEAAFTIGTDSHTPYGPGMPGFAKYAGVSLTENMVSEFFGAFLVPSVAHQDPRYHRMPNLSVRRRMLHVIDEVVIGQSDDGLPMFNYATVVGTTLSSALGNLYIPGRNNSFGSSTARIATALATDPIGNAITEFLPDLAQRVNIQVLLVQKVINRVAIEEGAAPPG